jgi:hypothetical protein
MLLNLMMMVTIIIQAHHHNICLEASSLSSKLWLHNLIHNVLLRGIFDITAQLLDLKKAIPSHAEKKRRHGT